MGSVWEGIRKAAATGAAKAQTAAENAVHRMEIQRRISQHEDELQSAFAGIGRELYAAVRGGQPVPEGVNVDVAALSALEAAIAQLKVDITRYGGHADGEAPIAGS